MPPFLSPFSFLSRSSHHSLGRGVKNIGTDAATTTRFVLFSSGLIHITLPNSTDDVWIHGGKYGLIVAADTRDVSTLGHRTEYPSAADTVALQVPIAEGSKFNHRILHPGACTEQEMAGF